MVQMPAQSTRSWMRSGGVCLAIGASQGLMAAWDNLPGRSLHVYSAIGFGVLTGYWFSRAAVQRRRDQRGAADRPG